jgi:hypothetical protein
VCVFGLFVVARRFCDEEFGVYSKNLALGCITSMEKVASRCVMESRLLKRHARYFVALSSSSSLQQQQQQIRAYNSHYTLVSGDDFRTVGKLAPQRLHGLGMITSVVAHGGGGGGLRSRVLSDGVMRAWTPLITTGQFFSRGIAAAGASPAREVVGADEQEQQQELERTTTTTSSLPEAPGLKEAEEVGRSPSETSKYWGVVGKTYTKEDGSTWSWKCFKVSVHSTLVISPSSLSLSRSEFRNSSRDPRFLLSMIIDSEFQAHYV